MNDALWGILLTAAGAVAVKVVEKILPSKEQTTSEMTGYRKELREDNKALREDNKALSGQIDGLERLLADALAKLGSAERDVQFWKERFQAVALELNELRKGR